MGVQCPCSVPANVDKFKKSMSPEEIATIEALAGDQMDYHGYGRMSADKVEITGKNDR